MNDGQQPKRNVFTYILPYILMAITVALFVWLIVSQTMGTTNVWSESNLDTYIGAYSTTTSSWVVDADGAHGRAWRLRESVLSDTDQPDSRYRKVRSSSGCDNASELCGRLRETFDRLERFLYRCPGMPGLDSPFLFGIPWLQENQG